MEGAINDGILTFLHFAIKTRFLNLKYKGFEIISLFVEIIFWFFCGFLKTRFGKKSKFEQKGIQINDPHFGKMGNINLGFRFYLRIMGR